jgi:predicted enzyme related to lactoylglutathione lyase
MPKFEKYAQGTPSYVELAAPDPEAGAAFYAALFGWDVDSVEMPPEAGGGYYRQGKVDGDVVAGISGQMPGMEGHPAFWGVYLTVDDVDAAAARVEPAGGKVEAPPFDVMDVGRMAAIQDPAGARVNLWQPLTSIGTERANEPGTPIWNELITADNTAALAFYADVVGLGHQSSELMEGYVVITNAAGEEVGGAMAPMMEGTAPHWNVYFNVEDADATAARIGELGGTTISANFDVPGVGRLGIYADPQGAMFNLMQSPPQ